MNEYHPQNGHYNWGIDGIVAELRDLRLHSLEARSLLNRPPKLPSRKEQYDIQGATAIALTMLVISFLLLLIINLLQFWVRKRSGQL